MGRKFFSHSQTTYLALRSALCANYCLNRTSRDTFVKVTLVDTAKYGSIVIPNNDPSADLSIRTPGLYLTLMKGLILSVIDLSFLLVGQWPVQTTPTGIQTSNNSPLNY